MTVIRLFIYLLVICIHSAGVEISGEHQDTLEFWSLFLELVDRSWANLASAVQEKKLRWPLTTSQLFRSRGEKQ